MSTAYEANQEKMPVVFKPSNSLGARADQLLEAAAVLGLAAAIADGTPDSREINSFYDWFRQTYALSARQARKIVSAAVYKIRNSGERDCVADACDLLNQHLDLNHKLDLFDSLTVVLAADKLLHEGEEIYLAYVAGKLQLAPALPKRYPLALTDR